MIKKEIFERIAHGYKTPAYVYEQGVFHTQLSALADSISWRPLMIYYAVKANSNFSVVKTLAAAGRKLHKGVGFGIDAVSPGEVDLGLNAGIPNQFIIYTGNNGSCEEIDHAKKKNVVINIDSLTKLEWFCNKYKGLNVCIRINPNVGAGHHDHCITGGPDSKFGIWYSQAQEALAIAKKKVKIIGIHQHIGSQILNPDTFIEAMKVMFEVAVFFPELTFIDFGGGFGVPYQPGEKPLDLALLGRKMTSIFADFCARYSRKLIMCIEPGRFLTAEAGYLLVRVTNVKRNPDGKVFVGVDSGFNHLDRPARYGSYHEIENISNPYGSLEEVIVVGNLCESGDKFTPKPRMIAEPREGDLLIIKNAGAYGYSMSSNYNLRPKPPEIMVTTNGTVLQIRKGQTTEELS
jgi:diaminopimelate decarboxylase